jgi:uncharacterized membrane protein
MIMKMIVKRLKSKTYWTAIGGALLVVVEQNSGFFSKYLPSGWQSVAVMMWPVLMIALREVTSEPVSDK